MRAALVLGPLGTGRGDLLQEIGPDHLLLDELIADHGVDGVPVVAQPGVGEPDAQGHEVAQGAALAAVDGAGIGVHPAHARNAERPGVLVGPLDELQDPRIFHRHAVFEDAAQGDGTGMEMAEPVPLLVA